MASEKKQVKMDDNELVEFSGKQKMRKTSRINAANGEVTVRLDFVNGEYRVLNIRQDMLAQYAAHGAEQKLGDEIAGVEDVEDCVAAIDQLIDRLDKGEWTQKREAGGLSGLSVLARAMVELTGKTADEIKSFLASKSAAEKLALRANARLKPIVERLEAEKAARQEKKDKPSIDTDELLAGLGA